MESNNQNVSELQQDNSTDPKITGSSGAESPEANSEWTWKDSLQRLQYIDTIINQIVHSAILLNFNFFAAFGFLQLQKEKFEIVISVRDASVIVAFFGLVINLFLAKSLARQEHIRKWYFSHLKNLPIMPPPDIKISLIERLRNFVKEIREIIRKARNMKPIDIIGLLRKLINKHICSFKEFCDRINIFKDSEPNNGETQEEKSTQKYESKQKEKLIIKFGKMKPGYCESWIIILICVAGVFLSLLYLSYFHIRSI